jgi:hypothetical protein
MPEKQPISAIQPRQMPVGRQTSLNTPRPFVAKLLVRQDLGLVSEPEPSCLLMGTNRP